MAYKKLLISSIISFAIMYAVMFSNVDDADHIYLSLTRVYMTLLMTAPMQIVMILLMGKMFPNKKMNTMIIAGCLVISAALFFLLRTQTMINDKQYMKAMIPHHSSAILTSKNATLNNPKVRQLSQQIIESQEREIAEMRELLKEIDK